MDNEGSRATIACESCQALNRVRLERLGDQPKCGKCGAGLHLDRPIVVTDRTLDAVVRNTDVPVLVDFYADWCGPCKAMAPTFAQLAAENAGRALFAKLDTDRNSGMARRFAIAGIPTLIAFRDGVEAAREVGALPRPGIEQLLHRVSA